MQVPVEQVYQQIGGAMIKAINDTWEKAWIQVEMEEDNSLLIGRYVRYISDPKSLSFKVDKTIVFAFEELWEQMRQSGKGAWKRARFTLQPGGEFDIDFDYDSPS
jgi:hypothetical protein